MNPHAVVIGAGLGGLAASIRLAAAGWRVTLLEQLDAPGGRAYVFRQDGHSFDAGPTIVTAPFLFDELWALCGKRREDHVTLKAMDPFYRVRFHDGTWFDYCDDPDRMRAEIAKFAPGDVPGYDSFMREAEKCFRLGFEGMAETAFDTFFDLIRVLPDFTRMKAWSSIHTLAARHFSHPKLRVVFSFHPLLIGGNPFSVTCAYSLIASLERRYGVHWAMGGTTSLVHGLVDLVQGQGTPIRYNAKVEKVLVKNGRACGVRLASGEEIASDIVVSNGDTAWTYRNLVDAPYRRKWTDAKLARARYSMSLFVWYFGTDRRFEDVPHHMMVLGPRYKELLDDIFKRKHLAEDFSLYLHRPSASDPSVAPPGRDTFYVLSPVPHLDSGTDWATHGDRYRDAIAAELERTVLPGLSQAITTSFYMTPQDFQDRLLSYKGAAFGMEPLLVQSAWFRPHNRSEDLPGLYVVGAGTHPGAGMPGVLASAKSLMSVLPPAGSIARA